jgi:hypothetical protein
LFRTTAALPPGLHNPVSGDQLRSRRLLFALLLLVLLLLLRRHYDLHLTDQSMVPSPSLGHMIAPITLESINERNISGNRILLKTAYFS